MTAQEKNMKKFFGSNKAEVAKALVATAVKEETSKPNKRRNVVDDDESADEKEVVSSSIAVAVAAATDALSSAINVTEILSSATPSTSTSSSVKVEAAVNTLPPLVEVARSTIDVPLQLIAKDNKEDIAVVSGKGRASVAAAALSDMATLQRTETPSQHQQLTSRTK